MEKCGCQIEVKNNGKYIIFCKMHHAAPKLLEACKDALNGGIDKGMSWEQVCNNLRATIAAAEGENENR